ncbi:PREDICTED: dnaJ homolog subfamily C member 17 isoform X1 [Galeopterus variegatus]|uniref:DnaJ homolog subfamily C member 17 isoform X1 n=1 Tax=Galeopterus variegatus TaxID=482537 RepID=A0ABM0QJC6_GALVR|nr:PREDICTED: dnaJ homolog subfamily C member 17 isoform X1 [Galeopterus variegatus]
MAVTKELLQMDLYALLGIEEKAADKEVKKAYRQKALSCHPDKNPDNPRAAELFHQLSQALEVLTDAAARAAYDKVWKAKKQAAERTQKLDERRKKVKLDLEARERQAQAQGSEEEEESRNTRTLEQEVNIQAHWPQGCLQEEGEDGPGWLWWLGEAWSFHLLGIWVICPTHRLLSPSLQVESPRDLCKVSQPEIGSAQNYHPSTHPPPPALQIERLREEGSRQLEEQQRLIQEQINQERDQRLRGKAENAEGKGTPKLKLKWKCKTEDKSKGGYSKDVLLRLLRKYGEVLNLVLSSKKAGTAVVEFATVKAAELAVQNEVGLVDNPLKISWLEGQPQGTMGSSHPGLSKGSVLSERDYESLVMMRMRQAAERQQLMAQMLQEDEEGQPT